MKFKITAEEKELVLAHRRSLSNVRMNRQSMVKHLDILNGKLAKKGITVEICVFGGSFITLMYDPNRMTNDIDAVFMKTDEEFGTIVREVAEEEGLRPDWLNDNIAVIVKEAPPSEKRKIPLHFSNLTIYRPLPEYVLAMKTISSRASTKDFEDIKLLVKVLGISSLDELIGIVRKHFPDRKIDYRSRIFLEELLKGIDNDK